MIPNGLEWTDPSADERAEAAGLRERLLAGAEVLLGVVGRVESQKAPEVLLDALELLPEPVLQRLRVVWAGRADTALGHGPFASASARHDCPDTSSFSASLGGCPSISRSTVFSSFDWEGFPNVVLEALAHGKPVVATDVGDVRALVEPGRSGWVVPPRDPAAFAAALLELLELSPARRAEMGRARIVVRARRVLGRAPRRAHDGRVPHRARGARRDTGAGGRINDRRLRILLIGPAPDVIEGAAVGGVTIPFKRLVELLRRRDDVLLTFVSTHGVRGGGIPGVARFLGVLCRIARAAPRADVVSLHSVLRVGFPLLGTYVWLVAGLARKPYVLRKFAGTDYSVYHPLRRALIHWVVKHAAAYLVETKALAEGARRDGIEHVFWYSNSRPMPALPPDLDPTRPCRRFVHLGQLRMGKGIREIIEAGERFGDDTVVDIYGMAGYDVPLSLFDGLARVAYRGPFPLDGEHDVLSRYDVLLLPTTLATEGYPGVVFEAYGAGLPVICTRWRQLPEIVDETTGILVEPRSADALESAMRRLYDDPALFARLRHGVRARRGEFSDDVWCERFVDVCREAVERRARR